MPNIIQDKHGNNSSMRVILLTTYVYLAYNMYLYTLAFKIEISKSIIDFQGLALLFTTMAGYGIIITVLKAWQTKYE